MTYVNLFFKKLEMYISPLTFFY